MKSLAPGFYRMQTQKGNRIGRFVRTSEKGLHFFQACDGKTADDATEILIAMDGDRLTPVRENRMYGHWEAIPGNEKGE